MSDIYQFRRGTAPLLISIPPLGSQIPDAQRAQMTPVGLESGDTDWHLDTLYRYAGRPWAPRSWARAIRATWWT